MRTPSGSLLTVETPGYAGLVHVREDGPADGRVLVLLHGFSGSLHWYDLVVPLLADTFRLVRVDLLGHGSTGGAAADAPVQAQAVAAVLEQLDVHDAVAVGHSFGADVAVELAENDDRVTGLVIVTQAPDYSDAVLPRGNRLMTLPVLGAAMYRSAVPLAMGLSAVVGRVRPTQRQLAAQAVADFRALTPGMFRVVLTKRRARMARRPLDAQVRDSGKATLVILGERDHFYGARSAPRYRAAGARVEILAESGHSPLVELPERMAALIAGFAAP
ncbi:alpha/beta fold hydrolase [uncultured Jatrophihabitans sp.]|uniref:alpha/beta fold hydrolase n=1 Tax=uncultured Jatrophihabitans sp. TaxID=1610747 RepID=UPI0035CA4C6C